MRDVVLILSMFVIGFWFGHMRRPQIVHVPLDVRNRLAEYGATLHGATLTGTIFTMKRRATGNMDEHEAVCALIRLAEACYAERQRVGAFITPTH